ncbi:MAG TPA: DUF4446 family protein [Candidatus Paceibacterota bacterium]
MTGTLPTSFASVGPLWAIVAFAFGIICIALLLISVMRLRNRLSKFMKGKDGASLEASLHWLTQKAAETDETLKAHKEALEFIDKRVGRSIRGYSLIRYDAYVGAGGSQSFSTALIDEHADGYILSVVANRNHTGVYAKRVTGGTAESSLTEEETQALTEAKKALR